MKRFLALAALVLGLASCQTEPEGLDVNVGGEVDTFVTVAIPDVDTRANSAESGIKNLVNAADSEINYTIRYIFEVYYGDNGVQKQVYYTDGQNASFPVRLVPGRDYNFVAWADIVAEPAPEMMNKALPYEGDPDEAHYNTSDLNAITFKSEWNAMNETRDAYTGFYNTADYENNKYTGSSSINIQMTRPFAKLRVLTTDMQDLSNLSIVPDRVTVKYNVPVYDSFNALVGEANTSTVAEKTFEYNLSESPYTSTETTCTLFTNYLFGTEDNVIKFEMSVYDNTTAKELIKTNDFSTDIPVQRNYLTTISGNILTDGNNINVKVEDAFAQPDYEVNVYNGIYDETIVLTTGTYFFNNVTVNTTYENAVVIAENANVVIDITGTVNFKSAGKAIYVPASSTLTINGSSETRSNAQNGKLTVIGGNATNSDTNGSAIAVDGTLIVNNIASLTAKGYGICGYGIGGIEADVTINNTTIDYVCGGYIQPSFVNDEKYGKSEPEGGAAIGGAKIVINGSTIKKAEGGSKAAAIGNRYWESTNIVIENSTLNDIFGGNASAAIGGSRYASDKTTHHSVKVTITDSTITNAVGGQHGAGIGSGYDTHCQAGGEGSTAVNEIIITNSTITAQGGKYAAGIGTGFHAASLTGSIDAESTINATSGEPFYKGTYTFAQHIGYGVIDLAREGTDLNVTFKVNNVKIDSPAVYATYNVVNDIEELKVALNAAIEGTNTIVLGADIEGDVTVVQKAGVKITIDGADHKFNGYFKVHSNSNHYASAAVTFKNIKFETAEVLYNEKNEPYFNFIEALENGTERYSTNITAENCTFTATGEAVNIAVGLQIKSSKNAKVLNCTATDMHSLIQAQSCDEKVEVIGCTINGKNGVAFKQVKAATVEGTTITAAEYGIRFDGNTDNYGIVVKDNNVTAAQPFIVRKMTGKDNTITLEGTNTLTTEAEYQIVITNGSDDQEYVKPTGTYTLTGADAYTLFPVLPVAKVGNKEYSKIDDAIVAWTNGTTLTLLNDATLSDVVNLNSTEHHILDLGTYTLTAAEGKNAFEIIAKGTGASERTAITIKADANKPGSINAGSKSVVYYNYANGTATGDDRPIIKIEGGIFRGATSSFGTAGIYFKGGSAARHAATLNISGGEFYCSINGQSKSKLLISGGLFHYSVGSQGDSTALRLISGGTFKTLGFMTADSNNTKFWFGTSMANSNVGLYINDDNYLVVGGPVITEFGDKFAAKATNATKWNSLLEYSSAATNGLYYTNAEMAIKKHGEANVVLK